MSLLTYMQSYLGNLESLLGWTSTSYDFPIAETLEKYGVALEADATDLKKLHAIGKVELWRAALRSVSFNYNFSADGASFSRSQIFDMVQKNYLDALTDAMVYLPEYQIEIGQITTTQENPYEFYPYYLRL
jgi:hypothetical protein